MDLDSSGDLSSRSIYKYDFHLEVQKISTFQYEVLSSLQTCLALELSYSGF
jgi:hypothetical protein